MGAKKPSTEILSEYDMTHFCCVVITGINYEHINEPDLNTTLYKSTYSRNYEWILRISLRSQDDYLSLSSCRSGAVAAVAVAADYGPQPTGRPRVPQHGARIQHHLQVSSHWPTRVT